MPADSLHVAQLNFFVDPKGRPPAELLDAWPSLVDVAEAASRSGVRVSVIQASSWSEALTRDGVDYRFLPFGESGAHKDSPLGGLLRRLAPDVLHVHGLGFPRELQALARLELGVPIIVQDHASRPPRFWRRGVWRRALSRADGIAFCALEQARPFADAAVIHPFSRLYEIPESTSRFQPGDREAARRITGLRGEPCILWVGHLDRNKDPLTVLAGVAAARRSLPELRLYCCFGAAPLMRRVRERIATDPRLRDAVHLLGFRLHQEIEQLMRAADVFVIGSHREGSGYSLIEALACGLPPAVTDIPSFRSLTGGGAVGALWPCDDAQALAAALLALAPRLGPQLRTAVRGHFENELSFRALGMKLASMYREVVQRARLDPSTSHRRGEHLVLHA
jgi:glycosyltransferase involved in cell wall biosynthesis